MNLDFGILWIEDSFSEQEETELRRRVQDAGFIARIETIPNGSGIEELGRRHQLYHLFDLILLDFKLKDEDGDELAPTVRALFPSTTILFYSGSMEEEELRRMIAGKAVEGVYCSARGRFIERTGALIDHTARSLDRLSGMRGLAMRVVAECDALMRTSVLSMAARDPACAAKVAELDDDVIKHMASIKERYEASMEADLTSRLGTFAVDSMKLFKHFRRLTKLVASNKDAFGLSDAQVERLRELRATSSQYDPMVLQKRNVLGHVIEVQSEKGWALEGSDEVTITDFPAIRQSFAVHIDAFRELKLLVTALDGE
jgi:CheY-like chemotaxis protein